MDPKPPTIVDIIMIVLTLIGLGLTLIGLYLAH